MIVDSPILSDFLRTLSPRTDGLNHVFNHNLLESLKSKTGCRVLLFAENLTLHSCKMWS